MLILSFALSEAGPDFESCSER